MKRVQTTKLTHEGPSYMIHIWVVDMEKNIRYVGVS